MMRPLTLALVAVAACGPALSPRAEAPAPPDPPGPDSAEVPAQCIPSGTGNVILLRGVAVFHGSEDPDAAKRVLVNRLWGAEHGEVVFFHNGASVGNGTLREGRQLNAHDSIAWPHEAEVWGIGGSTFLPRLSERSTFDAPLQGHLLTNCDPGDFLREASLDVEGDGVVDVEVGGRICPNGAAFEVRERQEGGEWEVLGRWITPWHKGEGRPRCE